MGVLNCTPDSFSDGGRYLDPDRAAAHGVAMWRAGARLIDVGGESSRPGAEPVAVEEELARVVPVVERLCAAGCRVSIDSRKPEVMRAAIAAGASMINDITALGADGALELAASSSVDICLMHMQGSPQTMQRDPRYHSVVDEVIAWLQQRVARCAAAGIARSRLVVDPGIGFGKRPEHNWALLRAVGRIREELGLPVLIGISRKSLLAPLVEGPPERRDMVSALAAMGPLLAGCDILRVHDVALHRQAAAIAARLTPC